MSKKEYVVNEIPTKWLRTDLFQDAVLSDTVNAHLPNGVSGSGSPCISLILRRLHATAILLDCPSLIHSALSLASGSASTGELRSKTVKSA